MIRLLKLLWIAWVTSICFLFTWAIVSPHVPKARLYPIIKVSDVSSEWKKVKDLALLYGTKTVNKQLVKSWRTGGGLYLVVCYDEEYRVIQFTEAKAKEILIVTYWENSRKCKVTHISNGVRREVSISLEDSNELVKRFLSDLKPMLRGIEVEC